MATHTTLRMRRPSPPRDDEDGVAGNERLTGLVGALLVPLLAVEGVTIVYIGRLINVHMYLGMLLIAPIGLKLATTGYRFVSYYAGRSAYRRKGPPPTPLRVLGAALVPITVLMLASGVALMFAGPSDRHVLLPVHKVSFIVWVAFAAVHVLAHLGGAARSVSAESGHPLRQDRAVGPIARRRARLAVITATLLVGVILGLVSVPQFGPWQHRHHDDGAQSARLDSR